MKRILVLLSLVAALFVLGACHYDINLSVEAWAELTYDNGDHINITPVNYEGFHRRTFSDSDLERIFTDLTQHASPDFRTAILHMNVFDEISGDFLRTEDYGVVYNSHTGHYDFADLNYDY